jgi:hypothetical protein
VQHLFVLSTHTSSKAPLSGLMHLQQQNISCICSGFGGRLAASAPEALRALAWGALQVKMISPQEMKFAAERGNILVVDVR